MSFGGAAGGVYNVANLTATFNLNAAPAMAAVDSVIKQTNTVKQSFATTYKINVDNRTAIKAIDDTTKSAGILKRALEFAGTLLGLDVLAKGFGALGNAIFGINGKLQQAQVSIQALTGNADTASQMVQKLETIASHSVFGLPQLTQASQQLLAFGVNAQNVPPLLVAIQNAAAASGGDILDKFTRINYVIAELNSGIPISARQLRQLATAGVPLQAIADQLGITTEALFTAGKTGIVTSQQIVTAFAYVYTHGNLGDFMKTQAGTFSGAMNLIKTNIGLAIAQAFSPLFTSVSNLVVKFGLFVQTDTFKQWVSAVQSGVRAVMNVLGELGKLLEPIGTSLGKLFGLNMGDIGKQIEAAKAYKVDVGTYDPSLQGNASGIDPKKAAADKAAIDDLKRQIDSATVSINGFTVAINANQAALDANQKKIDDIKTQYDPLIKSAQDNIKRINLLSPDELARKQKELELDKQQADLELTKPDTSAIADNITNLQAQKEAMQAFDSSPYQDAIQGLQDQISGLNTDELNQKIANIRDALSAPPPDTQGITNALLVLNGQLATGQIGSAAFQQQYGALSRQKGGIVDAYTASQQANTGQLSVLEQQKRDADAANAIQRRADEDKIRNIQRAEQVASKAHQTQVDNLDKEIKKQQDLEKATLAPYNAKLKVIEAQKSQNALLDAAASAQRKLDLAPWETQLASAQGAEDELLPPLQAVKDKLNETKNGLDENKRSAEAGKAELEAQVKAIKDAAQAAKDAQAAGIGIPPPGTTPQVQKPGTPTNELEGAFGSGVNPDSSPFVEFMGKVQKGLHDLVTSDDWQVVFYGHHADGTPVSTKERWDTAAQDIGNGISKIDDKLQADIKAHDASGIWGILIYGKNPDGSSATAKEQLGTLFGGINKWISDWFRDNGPAWLTSWDAMGAELRKGWDGPDSFNWGSVGKFFGDIAGGVDGWISEHLPGWLTSWTGLGSGLRRAWDGPSSFNWGSVGTFFAGVAGGVDGWISGNLPRWLTSWTGLGTSLKSAWDGPSSFNWGNIGGFFAGIATGIDEFGPGHFPGWLTSWQGFINGIVAVFKGLGSALETPINDALKPINGFIGAVVKGINTVGGWFNLPSLKSVTFTPFTIGGGSAAGAGGAGGGVATAATGHMDWPGGAVIHSEKGRELVHKPGSGWSLGRGPTLEYLPPGSTVLPNRVTESLLAAGVPGFAGGLGVSGAESLLSGVGGAARTLVGDAVGKSASALTDIVTKAIPDLTLPGVFSDIGPFLVNTIKDGMKSLITGLFPRAGRSGARGGTSTGAGYSDMAFDDYMNVVGQFPGYWDNRDFFDTLMSVAKERNFNPRWPMAVAEQEIGFGTTNRGLASIFNFWGMGYHDSPWDHPSGSAATDFGPSDYAAYSSFHDSLEDIFDYIAANGTSFGGGYSTASDAASQKQSIFDAIVAATPVPGASGAAGPFQTGGFPDVLSAALAHVGEQFHLGHEWNLWCEQFAELAGEDAGFPHLGYGSALAHVLATNPNSGVGPVGSTMLWGSGYYSLGHAAISEGDWNVVGTSPSGVAEYSMQDASDYRGWLPPGVQAGGFFAANKPRIVEIGEGANDEIAAPTPMLENIVRNAVAQAGAAGGDTYAFSGGITVVAAAGRERETVQAIIDEAHRRGVSLRSF